MQDISMAASEAIKLFSLISPKQKPQNSSSQAKKKSILFPSCDSSKKTPRDKSQSDWGKTKHALRLHYQLDQAIALLDTIKFINSAKIQTTYIFTIEHPKTQRINRNTSKLQR